MAVSLYVGSSCHLKKEDRQVWHFTCVPPKQCLATGADVVAEIHLGSKADATFAAQLLYSSVLQALLFSTKVSIEPPPQKNPPFGNTTGWLTS